MTAITVTSSTGATSGRQALTVRVLTGAAVSQPGATATSTTASSKAITPQATGSLVYGAYTCLVSSFPRTPLSGTTIIQDADNGGAGVDVAAMRSSATTTAGTPVTIGVAAKGETSFALALAEILASGTLAEDPSTPVPVPANGTGTMPFGTSVTTASFTPPGGSLLVALAETGTSVTPTVSDSSGLTWTQQALAASGAGRAAVWTAQVPGSVSTSPISEDASTPAISHTPYGASTSATSLPFSPPGSSLVVVAVNILETTGGSGGASFGTCTDSLGNVYSKRITLTGTGGLVSSAIYTYFYWGKPPGPITVTAVNATGTGLQDQQIAVRVLTGALAFQTGAATASFQAAHLDQTVTTTTAGSWVYIVAATQASQVQPPLDTGTTQLDYFNDPSSVNTGYIGVCKPAGAPGGVLMGWGNGTFSCACWVALEILPAPPAVTGSVVASVTEAATCTTTVS